MDGQIGPLPALTLACLLAACGGGGGGGGDGPFSSAYCDAIGGAVTFIADPACSGCRLSDPEQAADGALGSFATLSTNQMASGAGAAVRATSVEHPGNGKPAGVFFRLPEGAQAWSATVRTYLDGVEQNSSPPYSTPSTGTDGYVYGYFAVEATQPFDAIEIQVSAANYNAMPFDFRIYEFCSDAGAR